MARWKWGAGTVEGKVAEIVEDGKAEVTSNKVCRTRVNRNVTSHTPCCAQGNTVTRNARDGDPAVKISRKGVSWFSFVFVLVFWKILNAL